MTGTWTPPEFEVHIPRERVAQRPAERRDRSRLLVWSRAAGRVVHLGRFADLPEFFEAGELMVLNDAKVSPVRVEGFRPGGGVAELLFLNPTETVGPVRAGVLAKPSRRLKAGLNLRLPGGATFTLAARRNPGWEGVWQGPDGLTLDQYLERFGTVPLPPYVRRPPEAEDRRRYQTVYARVPGALAAPTAGLHFTDDLLGRLRQRRVQTEWVTLKVGFGTFKPITDGNLQSHVMEPETYHIPERTALAVQAALTERRPVTAVGTTVVRTLESAVGPDGTVKSGRGVTALFIKPPHRFRAVGKLVTNFHRPDSTLLQLVAAFIGWEGVNRAYQTAVDEGFRFFSYGDAMLVV